MKIGYNWSGYMSDFRLSDTGAEVSIADGFALHGWALIQELQKRGITVYGMSKDRDAFAVGRWGKYAFTSFSMEKRWKAYSNLLWYSGDKFPELDVLILEWQHSTIFNSGPSKMHDSLEWQERLLEHYTGTATEIVVLDIKHNLTEEEERKWNFDMVVEPSFKPNELYLPRVSALLPFDTEELTQYPMMEPSADKPVVYIGTRGNKEEILDLLAAPLQEHFPQKVHMWGDWLQESGLDSVGRWPLFKYHKVASPKDFYPAYYGANLVPLWNTEELDLIGGVGQRFVEALVFGALPLGFESNIASKILFPLDCLADDHWEIVSIVADVEYNKPKYREALRNSIIERTYEYLDPARFVDKILF